MSEQLESLYELALQQIADEHASGDVSRLNVNAYTVQKMVRERFATMIIRTCAAVADKTQFELKNFPVSIAIENHFDIEWEGTNDTPTN